jgi:predicted AlkP superfamily pyrophosphatase or phosphodiesterase
MHCGKKPALPEVIPVVPEPEYKTQNVIIVMIDGPRYTETWGDPSHTYIPKRYALLKEGVLCNALYNNGTTSTVPGHIAITTGFYQHIANDGTAYPDKPSIFQHWLQTYNQASSKAWVIATKDKLEVLSDCVLPDWKGKYRPMSDCGIAGLGTGQRNDGVTLKNAQSILSTNHPQLVLINFRQPDVAGHGADSAGYLKGIVDTDNYVELFWQQLQSDNFYKNKTTMIVANDHGRHTAGHLNGYVTHGDSCDGCRHIEMFAIGPDFKRNYISNVTYEQIDITSTIAALMKLEMPYANGKIMSDIFR